MIQKNIDKLKLNIYLAGNETKRGGKEQQKRLFFGISILLVIFGLLFQPFLPSLNLIQAAGPRFNIFTPYTCAWAYNRDYYLICVKNDTKVTDYSTGVSADAGDILSFSVYYHNGVNGTIATNTKLRVNIPSGSRTSHTVSAYLWADNAENATAGNPLTFSNTVNVSSSQSLEYIQNSAKWFPDQRSPLTDSPVLFPFGQTGNEITGNGVNVGDIEGCWEFSGMVNFKVKVSQVILTPNLSISKTVKNITNGETNYSESTQAKNGDRVAFSLKIDSIGNASAQNVIVSDSLPSGLSYVSGTLDVDGNSSYSSASFFGSGINIGSINQGNSKTVTFEATVSVNANTTLTNYGKARADQVSEKQDSASVFVYQVIGDLTIVKKVRNITENEYQFNDSTNAHPRQTLEFSLTITSVGTVAANNVIVRDQLPDRLLYVNGSTRVNDATVNDGIASSGGINIGSIAAGQSKVVKFKVDVEREAKFPRGQTNLTNYGFARADGISEKSDTADVIVIYSGCNPENNSPGRR